MMCSILWVGYPRSYTPGRSRPIQFVTLHYTAGSEGPSSAENGATYDKNRLDGTSTHYFTDSLGPALQEVPDGDRAHAARMHGNEIGIQIEICGTAQTRAQWLDATSYATLQTTACLVATLLQRHGLAFKRLTTAETRAAYFNAPGSRPTGINDHAACTLAFPEDGGSHMDMGTEFPWDVFMDLVSQELGEGMLTDLQAAQINNSEHYLQSVVSMTPNAAGIDNLSGVAVTVTNKLTAVLQDIQAKVNSPVPVEVDADAVAEALAANAEFLDAIAAAVARKLVLVQRTD